MRAYRGSEALLAVGALFLVCGLAFLAVGVPAVREQYLRTHALVHQGVFATGVVLSKSRTEIVDWAGFGSTYHYQVTYRFEIGRERYADEAEIDASTWDGLTERGPIEVRYLPQAPRHHAIVGQVNNWFLAFMLTSMGTLFASLGGALAAFGVIRSCRRALQHAPARDSSRARNAPPYARG